MEASTSIALDECEEVVAWVLYLHIHSWHLIV
jgi:hypothetical protein